MDSTSMISDELAYIRHMLKDEGEEAVESIRLVEEEIDRLSARIKELEEERSGRLDLAGRAKRRGVTIQDAPGVQRTIDLLTGGRPREVEDE